DGGIYAIWIKKRGNGYEKAPRVTIEGDGEGATATAKIKQMSNPVAAELIGIAERLRAIVVIDGPNTTDEEVIKMRRDFDSKRAIIADPFVSGLRKGRISQDPASSVVADIIAKTDFTHGVWHSPSNKVIDPISGVTRPIDFAIGDSSSRANMLIEKH
ncbi:phage tail sheath subtilisin-like domain-containing protein, partial [Bartonella taylorii]|uniref:phage tail sheath subtilisin-like domain-containing protein n=1 Tax=Bartonella taylorii TaxID=33046 RepID=UPI001ABA5C08